MTDKVSEESQPFTVLVNYFSLYFFSSVGVTGLCIFMEQKQGHLGFTETQTNLPMTSIPKSDFYHQPWIPSFCLVKINYSNTLHRQRTKAELEFAVRRVTWTAGCVWK